jgi:hypothetical protein
LGGRTSENGTTATIVFKKKGAINDILFEGQMDTAQDSVQINNFSH